MKGYMCLRDRKYMDFFCDVVLWFCLLVGLVLMPSDGNVCFDFQDDISFSGSGDYAGARCWLSAEHWESC